VLTECDVAVDQGDRWVRGISAGYPDPFFFAREEFIHTGPRRRRRRETCLLASTPRILNVPAGDQHPAAEPHRPRPAHANRPAGRPSGARIFRKLPAIQWYSSGNADPHRVVRHNFGDVAARRRLQPEELTVGYREALVQRHGDNRRLCPQARMAFEVQTCFALTVGSVAK